MVLRSAAILIVAVSAQQRGGPTGIFRYEVPPQDLSVVQCLPTSNSVTLSLMATKDLAVSITTKAKVSPARVALKAYEPKLLTLTGLKPGARTPYDLEWEGGRIAGTAQGLPSSGQPSTIVITADSHLDENTTPATYTQTLRRLNEDKPDVLVDLGDTFMTGKHAQYQEAIKQYRAQRYYFGIPGTSAPVFLVLGNHDGETGWVERGQTGMTEWSATQRRLHFPTSVASGPHYFGFRSGDAEFWVLDPFTPTKDKPARTLDGWRWTLGESQYRWLESSLAKSTAKYRFVLIHHLVGGEGKDARGGSEASRWYEWGGKSSDGNEAFTVKRPGFSMPIHDLLRKHSVDVVFHGHDHFYAHQVRDGMHYQLVPQPGHARGSARIATDYGYKEGTFLPSSGYMRVTLSKSSAAVEYIKTGQAEPADRYVIQP